ncbi:MAG: hypothetical protein M3Z56_01340, partial [Bacteroidota bacterium]|nr:hypothetical protein [Bacteroidota bacterium]
MRLNTFFTRTKILPAIFIIAINAVAIRSHAQQLKFSDFVLFGGSGVSISSSANINGGSVGSFTAITAADNDSIKSNINSGGKIQLSNNNTVTGNITAANSNGLKGIIFSAGASSNIGGNIDVNGNIRIAGGTVSGTVTHPAGTTYTGPTPAGGNITGTPSLPVLPNLPAPVNFPRAGSTDITSSATITPGAYGNIMLSGKQTLTLSGTGVYTFKSIKNSGSINTINFDFKNAGTGTFKIYIYNNADLNKSAAVLINGGSESRVYTEVHGKGANTATGAAFIIANGSSSTELKWLGTVYATSGSISIGRGTATGKSINDISGVLISAAKVTLQNGVYLQYAPFVDDVILPYYPPPPTGKVYDLLGSELNALYYNRGSVTDTAQNIFRLAHDSVYIEVIALQGKVAQLLSLLQSPGYGLTNIINNGPKSLIISGKFPIANLLKLDLLTNLIDYCRPLFPPINNGRTGLTTTNGDIAIHTDFVRNGYNVTGDSVKVGVNSDSYNTLFGNPAAVDVANGDLPGSANPYNDTANVQVLQEYPFGRSTDEGRAMLQIVHDIAPKATLGFRTGFISAGDFAQGILQLQQNNYDVIVDDVTYITEPFLQDGEVAQAVNQVTAQGVSYFSAAGNFGNTSYASNFNPAPAPNGLVGTAHNFGGGDILQNISLTPGNYTLVLQWQDNIYSLGQSSAGTVNDLDI